MLRVALALLGGIEGNATRALRDDPLLRELSEYATDFVRIERAESDHAGECLEFLKTGRGTGLPEGLDGDARTKFIFNLDKNVF